MNKFFCRFRRYRDSKILLFLKEKQMILSANIPIVNVDNLICLDYLNFLSCKNFK